MRYSALWSPFFFIGLLLACTRLPEGMHALASRGEDPTHAKVVLVHRVKVAIETRDSLAAREPALAEAVIAASEPAR